MLLEHDPVYYKTKDTGSVNHKNTGCRKKKKNKKGETDDTSLNTEPITLKVMATSNEK